MIPLVHVAAGIVWQNSQLLVARRREGTPRGGYWEFPGGKQEKGETMEQTLLRELHEEVGIHCEHIIPWCCLFHKYSDLHVELHFMHVVRFSGTPAPLEGQSIRWVTPQEAENLNFLSADVQILDALVYPIITD